MKFLRQVASTLALASLVGGVGAFLLCGCADTHVTSNYKPPPKTPEITIALPAVQLEASTPTTPSIHIPLGKLVKFEGRIVGSNQSGQPLRRAFVTLYVKGQPNRIAGQARLRSVKGSGDGNAIDFFAILEPLRKSGPRDLVIEIRGERIATFDAAVGP